MKTSTNIQKGNEMKMGSRETTIANGQSNEIDIMGKLKNLHWPRQNFCLMPFE